MSGLPFLAPWLMPVSLVWAMLPLLCPRQRRTGIVIALTHLFGTVVITQPWTTNWYWDTGWWMLLVFGQGTLIALGRLVFELSPLGARRRNVTHRPSDDDALAAQRGM
ncbi:hypothetical protein [Streptomyces sp. NPDC058867]|uniref:hypothetical protein n=1 Tax=unclassified Streptomyces TaxID=2593676 RepID=UPI0036C2946B